jgi:predicted dehydrogenase
MLGFVIRVGLVGANPERGWAARSHLPALAGHADVELVAVATTRRDSADEAARRWGARHAFADAYQLIGHPDVDLVTVAVRVPYHEELVTAAIKAGKHVYCEWPLVVTAAQARELRDLAETRGVRTAVGLQARHNPRVRALRRLVADGQVGEVLSATLTYAAPSPFRTAIPPGMEWMADVGQGANVLTISGGHALDMLRYVLGTVTQVSGILATRTHVSGVTSPDQVLVQAVLDGGAVASAHVQWGGPESTGLRLEIHGTAGRLVLSADQSLAASPLRITDGAGEPVDLDRPGGDTGTDGDAQDGDHGPRPGGGALPGGGEGGSGALPGGGEGGSGALPGGGNGPAELPAANVARLYAAFAGSIRTGAPFAPDFSTALSLHELLDAIRVSAATGQRQSL